MSPAETQEAFAKFYPVPAGYQIDAVDIQKYSTDFRTLSLSRVEFVPEATVTQLPLEAA